MTLSRVLLVDDNDEISAVFQEGLENYGFDVVIASGVRRALNLITSEQFDVLLYDLHTPDASDVFVVVNALLHVHPNTVLLVLSRYPALQGGLSALLLKPDEILLKPVRIVSITQRIRKMLENPPVHRSVTTENVAAILQRDMETTIHSWMRQVERNEELCGVELGYADRTAHLPNLFNELISRLRSPSEASIRLSTAAHEHGILRRQQGYTAAMVVEESRILQLSIFKTLQDNLRSVDFSKVLVDVRTIADEVDSQLKQQILGYMSSKPAKSAAA
ncbi:MAG TPA: response regulator [Candidatus Cybelea sp.]|jgi:DNA-binding response OmpR family regulator|nr:response regulator [Candidatus Cybelea sp.]